MVLGVGSKEALGALGFAARHLEEEPLSAMELICSVPFIPELGRCRPIGELFWDIAVIRSEILVTDCE